MGKNGRLYRRGCERPFSIARDITDRKVLNRTPTRRQRAMQSNCYNFCHQPGQQIETPVSRLWPEYGEWRKARSLYAVSASMKRHEMSLLRIFER